MIMNIPQPIFEKLLHDSLANEPNVDIRKGLSFVTLEQVSTVLQISMHQDSPVD
jgi:hypothetical protein